MSTDGDDGVDEAPTRREEIRCPNCGTAMPIPKDDEEDDDGSRSSSRRLASKPSLLPPLVVGNRRKSLPARFVDFSKRHPLSASLSVDDVIVEIRDPKLSQKKEVTDATAAARRDGSLIANHNKSWPTLPVSPPSDSSSSAAAAASRFRNRSLPTDGASRFEEADGESDPRRRISRFDNFFPPLATANPMFDETYPELSTSFGDGTRREKTHEPGYYGIVSAPLEEELELVAAMKLPIAELAAGKGYWSRCLYGRGCDVVAYDEDPPEATFYPVFKAHATNAAAMCTKRALLLVRPRPYDIEMVCAVGFHAKNGGQFVVISGPAIPPKSPKSKSDDLYGLLKKEYAEICKIISSKRREDREREREETTVWIATGSSSFEIRFARTMITRRLYVALTTLFAERSDDRQPPEIDMEERCRAAAAKNAERRIRAAEFATH